MDTPFSYDTITALYSSGGVLQNQATYTPYTRDKILRLRKDIDTLGGLLSITGANWNADYTYVWSRGDHDALVADRMLWKDYITDMRTACEELATAASVSAPSWTIATITALYNKGDTATIASNVLTQTGIDFADITNNTDYCYIRGGTGANAGRYLITNSTTDTLTISGSPGTSSAGDVEFIVLLSGNKAGHTDSRKKTLITDVQTAILTVADATGTIRYWVDAVGGSDSNSGTRSSPYETWDKVAAECNSTAGNIFLFNGSYLVDTVTLAPTSISIVGESTAGVVVDVALGTDEFLEMQNLGVYTIKSMTLGDGTAQGLTLSKVGASSNGTLNLEFCVFRSVDASGARALYQTGDWHYLINAKHCSFYGSDDSDVGFKTASGRTMVFDDCHFYDTVTALEIPSGASKSLVTFNYCTFENVTTKVGGGLTGTETNNNEHTTSTDNVTTKADGHLYDESDLINASSTSADIGAYPDGWYNVKRSTTDSLTLAELNGSALLLSESDSLSLHENLETTSMNVSIDMLLSGLFESPNDGSVSYLNTGDFTHPTAIPDFTYNGAFIDLSWDNASGDNFEVHITVDDGVSDYTAVAWWETNGANPAKTTTDVSGARGYAIDCYTETLDGTEWGDGGDFSTVAADGENDQQWDITLKVRLKNLNTGTWSEVTTIATTRNFNTWPDTMYFCADNPRSVDGEYANHANYLPQTYHTGTSKYTRPDGVDWVDDNRNLAFSPWYRFHRLLVGHLTGGSGTGGTTSGDIIYWSQRQMPSTGIGNPHKLYSWMILYTCLFGNYGNYNNSGSHCFASPTTTQPYDKGTAAFTNPVLDEGNDSKCKYFYMQAYLGSDCAGHSSFPGGALITPSGQLISVNNRIGYHEVLTKNNMFFLNPSDNPYISCAGPTWDDKNYLWIKSTSGVPGDYDAWQLTYFEIWANTGSIGGALEYGSTYLKKLHSFGSDTFFDQW